jgi:hypothetical protein
MIMKKLVVFLAYAVLVSGSQAKETWVFVAPELVNYDSTRFAVLGEQLAQELALQGNIDIVKINRTVSALPLEKDTDKLKKLLADYQAHFGISGNLSRLDQTVFIYMEKWDTRGTVVFRDRVTVETGEDLQVLIKRLAKGLIDNQSFAATATTTTITHSDSKQSARKGGGLQLVGRAGFLYPVGNSFTVQTLNYNNSMGTTSGTDNGTTFSMEGGFAFDIDKVIAEATMSIDGNRALSFTIAGEVPLGQGDFCPYLGAEVGATVVNKAESGVPNESELEKNSDGISLGVRAGLLVFRNNSFKLMPEIRWLTVINKNLDSGVRLTIGTMLF